MFRGTFEHTIDDKGRLSVPSRFRDLIAAANDGRVVVTNFQFEKLKHLEVHPYAAWLRLEEAFQQKPQFDPRIRSFQNYFFARAQDCQLDRQGRILLPPTLREYAALERDVVVTGVGPWFNVWEARSWNQVFGTSESTVFADPSLLEAIGRL